jgi:16S rRNA (adenine1518-N6/adenine1519-N6)-dimethyltransferase
MDEIVDVADEKDDIIGEALKSECHEKGLWHRGVAIIVKNKQNKILIQKRSPYKEKRPNLLCISASGHVLKGETYEQAAKRELQEELGIIASLKLIGSLPISLKWSEKDIEKEHTRLFICQWDKELKFQESEITWIKFLSQKEIQNILNKEPEKFNPSSIIEFKRYFQK